MLVLIDSYLQLVSAAFPRSPYCALDNSRGFLFVRNVSISVSAERGAAAAAVPQNDRDPGGGGAAAGIFGVCNGSTGLLPISVSADSGVSSLVNGFRSEKDLVGFLSLALSDSVTL